MFFLMQNIFIVPAMQHDCCAKPLYLVFASGSGRMLSRYANYVPSVKPGCNFATGEKIVSINNSESNTTVSRKVFKDMLNVF